MNPARTKVGVFALTLATVMATIVCVGQPAERARDLRADEITSAIRKTAGSRVWGAVLVAKEGQVVYFKGFGDAAPDRGPITPESLFDIGSVSKQFTAAGVLKLQQSGKLSLDAPAASFFPTLDIAESGRSITLRHLLTHTSGLTDQRAIQPLVFPDRDEAVRRALSSRPQAGPGEQFEYCNAGYVVLAAVIEVASGERFEDYLRRAVMVPAGLGGEQGSHAGFLDGVGLDAERQTQRVTFMGGRREGLLLNKLVEPWAWGLRGAGGVVMSPAMFVRWDAALAGGAILNVASKQEMFTPGMDQYGMGWWITSTARGTTRQTHTGGTRGYSTCFSRFPDEGTIIVVMLDEQSNAPQVAEAVEREVFPTGAMGATAWIDASTLTLNEHSVQSLESGVLCDVLPGENGTVLLELRHSDKVVARVTLLPGEAAEAGAKLRGVAASNRAGKPSALEPSTGLVLAAEPYKADAQRVFQLPEGLATRVQAQYVGTMPDGTRITDPRPILVIVDRQRGFWPVIIKFSNSEADRVGEELLNAANGR